jgi:Protein of unknown function (DUF2911)
MRFSLQISSFVFSVATLCAQSPVLTTPPSGNNQRASVSQFIGPIKITLEYSSPAVHSPTGEDRRGKIWGKLVPFGLAPIGAGSDKDVPWRAGANENTTFSASEAVTIEGKPLTAGTYGLHMIPGPEEWTVIFSRNASAWGSFFYDKSEDALRVTVKPHKHDYREWLAYDFPVRKPDETTAELQWEDLAVPFTIKANVNASYITHLRHELTGAYGFDFRAYLTAAQFCLQANTDMEQGMRWAEAAVSMPGIGQANFDTLSTKAQFLAKLGKESEVKAVMTAAINSPGTTPTQIHLYGRQLLAAHKNAEAMEIFKLNAERNGDAWPTHVGLARGYSAQGDVQKALEHAQKALAQAPDALNRTSLEAMIKTLSEGHPINN